MTAPLLKAAIFGASGYAGGELLRLLLDHPKAEPVAVISRSQAGQPVSSVHAHLSRLTDLNFISELPRGTDEPEVIFLAGGHGYAAEVAPALLDTGIPVVDLSADFRLKDPRSFEKFYGPPPAAFERRNEWVYGLPELFRDQISASRAVASPGCFATASILALAPLWRRDLVAEGAPVSVFAITGSSGAGVSPSPTTHHPRRAAAFFAYQIEGHRHLPEIEESLSAIGRPAAGRVVFQTHSAPLVRGIFATCVVPLKSPMDQQALKDLYREAYGNEFFVRLVDGSPDVAAVKGTNFADIGVATQGNVAKVFIAIDNLVKGAAGQAIQAMNIMFGLPEPTGLKMTGVFP
ncbi:MAG TPA: N-acetyl-gamma-glutamyl-phosphate reductase [Thermoanaerobaculia bacterium]|nr:N-acetyl-gamma-glutamyl-phosphate reductase [Thermoanaerobaculia bacterium]